MVRVTPDLGNRPPAAAAATSAVASAAPISLCGLPPFIEVHQLLSGREFAHARPRTATDGTTAAADPIAAFAAQMGNYVYAVVDRRDGTAALVDPCWDVAGIYRHVMEDLGAARVAAVVYTHRHFDHTGGRLPMGMTGGRKVVLEGLAEVAAMDEAAEVGVGATASRNTAYACTDTEMDSGDTDMERKGAETAERRVLGGLPV
jgi:hypothetical protein